MKYKEWESCPYYQEMYALKDTWESLEACKMKVVGKPDNCEGCPLLTEAPSDKLPLLDVT